jgi:competence protein ComGC
MKKVTYYALVMLFVVVLISFLIVKSCNTDREKKQEHVEEKGMEIKVHIKEENKVRLMNLEE